MPFPITSPHQDAPLGSAIHSVFTEGFSAWMVIIRKSTDCYQPKPTVKTLGEGYLRVMGLIRRVIFTKTSQLSRRSSTIMKLSRSRQFTQRIINNTSF
ncbi:hypothetical protein H6F61_08385 [Cyanobacteria bacterium FACHB-472]|nr:hypothetical protein [Cyanobacteria bacterium FACHB-472]